MSRRIGLWCLSVCLFVVVVTGTVCEPQHVFCRDERTGGLRTNQPEVIVTPNVGSAITDVEGPLRVLSGHHLLFNGILHTAATIRVTGSLVISGGAEVSLHDVVVVVSDNVELRDDSRVLMSLNSYIGYTNCADIGEDVALEVEASLYDPALKHPIVALRPSVSGDSAESDPCLNGGFATVTVVDVADQGGTTTKAEGSTCSSNAGSLAAVFGAATCPAPPPPPPIAPNPPRPAPVGTSTGTPTGQRPPDTAGEPTMVVPGDHVATAPPGASGDGNSAAWIIVAVMASFLVLTCGFVGAVYRVPWLRKRFFPFRDLGYGNDYMDDRRSPGTEMADVSDAAEARTLPYQDNSSEQDHTD